MSEERFSNSPFREEPSNESNIIREAQKVIFDHLKSQSSVVSSEDVIDFQDMEYVNHGETNLIVALKPVRFFMGGHWKTSYIPSAEKAFRKSESPLKPVNQSVKRNK